MAGLLASRASVLHGGLEKRPPRRASCRRGCRPQVRQVVGPFQLEEAVLGTPERPRHLLAVAYPHDPRIERAQPAPLLRAPPAAHQLPPAGEDALQRKCEVRGHDGIRLMRARSHLIRPVRGNWKARPAGVRPDELLFVLRRGARPKRPFGADDSVRRVAHHRAGCSGESARVASSASFELPSRPSPDRREFPSSETGRALTGAAPPPGKPSDMANRFNVKIPMTEDPNQSRRRRSTSRRSPRRTTRRR